MNTSLLKSTLVAAAVLLLAPAAQATEPSRDTGVGNLIAAQGNAALRQIRKEMGNTVRGGKPAVSPRFAYGPRRRVTNDHAVTLLVRN